MKGTATPGRVDRIVSINAEKLDAKLEMLLDEFDNYDFTYKPLLTQHEFEKEFLRLIHKVFRRKNKYEILENIFEDLMNRSLDDQQKFLCLVDFTINISKYDPSTFKDLPNDVISKVANEPIFLKVQNFIYNKGRMNYRFKKFKKKSLTKEDNESEDEHLFVPSDDQDVSDNDNSSESSDENDSSEDGGKVMNVSLAELTRKIMSKTVSRKKQIKNKKKSHTPEDSEDSDPGSDDIMNEFDSEGDDSGYDEIPGGDVNSSDAESDNETPKEYEQNMNKRTTYNSLKSQLENLVESDYDTSEESLDDEDGDDEKQEEEEEEEGGARYIKNQKLTVPGRQTRSNYNINVEDLDSTMNNATSIMEHIIDYRDSEQPVQRMRTRSKRKSISSRIVDADNMIRIGNLKIRAKQPKIKEAIIKDVKIYKPGENGKPKARKAKQMKPTKKPKNREPSLKKTKISHPIILSPVRRKAFLTVENSLDFLYTGLERLLPSYKATLSKKEIYGFTYKPAQYSLFENLPETVRGVDSEIARFADNLLNTFVFQLTKRCGGNDIDQQQYVHPFEYNHIMDNFDGIKAKGTALPPMIIQHRYSSLLNDDGRLSNNISLLKINDTKVKGLLRLRVFESEEEYFQLFKKIVPRDHIAKRLEFLNSLVTDGTSLYIVDHIDIIQGMMSIGKYQVDSELEERNLIERERKLLLDNKDKILEMHKLENSIEKDLEASKKTEIGYNTEPESTITEKDETNTAERTVIESPHEYKDTREAMVAKESYDINIANTTSITESTTQNLTEANEEETKLAKENQTTTTESPESTDAIKSVETTAEPSNKTSSDLDILFDADFMITAIEKENQIKMEKAKKSMLTKRIINPIDDDRETTFCSAKGLRVPAKSIHKVFSTQEMFEMLAYMLFPNLRIDTSFESTTPASLSAIGHAYDQFRPYLLSLFFSDVLEFVRLPRYFRLDSMMFELQLQDLLKTANPTSKMRSATFKN